MAGGDAKFRLILEGDDKQALASIDKTVAKLNDVKAVMKRHSMERQKIARDERRDRFQALSDEEKRARLTQRQITLERQLARARASGNAGRSSALGLSVARNRAAISGMGGPAGAAAAGGGMGAVLGMAGRGLAALGIGVSIAGIARALSRAVSSSLRFADEIGDLAEQTGLTRIQVLKIRRSSAAAGVASSKTFGSLSTLGNARSGAISGDTNMRNTFAQYGVGMGDLQDSGMDNASIARKIKASLGKGGMLPTDAGPLQSLFGKNPGKTLAALGSGEETAGDKDLAKTLQSLDQTNRKLELVLDKLQEKLAGAVAKTGEAVTTWPKWMTDAARALRIIPGMESIVGPAPNLQMKTGPKQARPVGGERTAGLFPTMSTMAAPSSDALARIGLYQGGIEVQRLDIFKGQLNELKAIKNNTQRAAEAAEEMF